jgi:hypothetical protein
MSLLKKITSFVLMFFVVLFFSMATLTSCGTKDQSQESTETEHPVEEAEHPSGEEEHPSGDEHPTGAEEDTTEVN